MANEKRFDVDRLKAIDVHVHIEHEGAGTKTDQAAKEYFGGAAARGRKEMADTIALGISDAWSLPLMSGLPADQWCRTTKSSSLPRKMQTS